MFVFVCGGDWLTHEQAALSFCSQCSSLLTTCRFTTLELINFVNSWWIYIQQPAYKLQYNAEIFLVFSSRINWTVKLLCWQNTVYNECVAIVKYFNVLHCEWAKYPSCHGACVVVLPTWAWLNILICLRTLLCCTPSCKLSLRGTRRGMDWYSMYITVLSKQAREIRRWTYG